MKINVKFTELECAFKAAFGEVHEINHGAIPSDYGKITYTQDKTIIIS